MLLPGSTFHLRSVRIISLALPAVAAVLLMTSTTAGPMSLSWLPSTSQGRLFGDYISTSVNDAGRAYPTIAVASAPTGG
jgi:hypothetical protein